MMINDKEYPLWSQFVERKSDFIGSKLQDFGEMGLAAAAVANELGLFPPLTAAPPKTTEITDIRLDPNGQTSAFFRVCGKDFTCGFDVGYGGITAGAKGWITFCEFGGRTWRIEEPGHLMEAAA